MQGVYNQRSMAERHARQAEGTALERSNKAKLKVVFMGSDKFSLPSFEACLERSDVVAVYTQPDRRSGRGRKRLTCSPVKELAVARGLHIEQPEKFDSESTERLREFEPDLTVVAAYGQLLPPKVLAVARLDSINVHASLLPRHRGAAPIAAAIETGDTEAGVTIMKLRPKLDAGEIIACGGERRRAQAATRIGEDETAGALAARLAELGGELTADVLAAFADGSVTYEQQDEALATYAPTLRKSEGEIDWSRPADEVVRRIRAMTPWPGAYTELYAPPAEPLRIAVLRSRVCEDSSDKPGRLCDTPDGRLVVSAGAGSVELLEVKPAGRKAMDAAEFLRGCLVLRNAAAGCGDCWFGST